MADRSVAVVMVGGPSTSNFRALGSVPAPLFPIAGRPLLDHPIRAAAAVPGLTAVFVVGFYEERDFSQYLSSLSAEIGRPVRYMREARGHGSAGGLHQFRSVILEDNPASVFVLYCDVCCTWPLNGTARAARARTHAPSVPLACMRPCALTDAPADLLAAHRTHAGAMGTMLVKRVAAAKAGECGAVVADDTTRELLHYTERPETYVRPPRACCRAALTRREFVDCSYVSDLVNTGVCVLCGRVCTLRLPSALTRRVSAHTHAGTCLRRPSSTPSAAASRPKRTRYPSGECSSSCASFFVLRSRRLSYEQHAFCLSDPPPARAARRWMRTRRRRGRACARRSSLFAWTATS